MTVKQVAEKVYGPIPDGVTLHIGCGDCMDGENVHLTVDIKKHLDNHYSVLRTMVWKAWSNDKLIKGYCRYTSFGAETAPGWFKQEKTQYLIGPDISDRDASAFLGFFGKEFDDAVARES